MPSELDKKREVIQRWLDGGCNSWGTPVEQIRSLLASVAEAEPGAPSGMGVKVKALEWSEAIHGGWVSLGAGVYHVHGGSQDGRRFYFFTNPFDHEPNEFVSAEAAKAAAQADYEQRIRSALIPPVGSDAGEITDETVERALDAYCKIVPMGVEPRRDGMRAALSAAALTRLPDAGWRPIETAPKDTPILAILGDSGIRLIHWVSPEQTAEELGGSPDDYNGVWAAVADHSEQWEPKFWLPRSALPDALPDTGRE